MWYPVAKKIKIAGADNVLQGGMDVGETLSDTLKPYLYKYQIEQLPSHGAILKFFRTEFLKFLRQLRNDVQIAEDSSQKRMAELIAAREMQTAESFIKTCIRLYQDSPKHAHLVYPFYEELARVVAVRREFKPEYAGYFYDPSNRSTDDSWWLSNILSSGYNNLLNLEKLGLYFPPQFKFAIMAGLDVKAKPILVNDPQRKMLVQYIAEKYPFYRRFVIENGDDTLFQDTVRSMVNPTPGFIEEIDASSLPAERAEAQASWSPSEHYIDQLTNTMFASSLPTEDQIRYVQVAVSTPAEDTDHKVNILKIQLSSISGRQFHRVIDTVMNKIYGQVSEDDFEHIFKHTVLYEISSTYPRNDITEDNLEEFKQHPVVSKILQKAWEKCKDETGYFAGNERERLIKMGIAPLEYIRQFIKQYPRSAEYFMGTKEHKATVIRIKEEAEKEAAEAEKEANKTALDQILKEHAGKSDGQKALDKEKLERFRKEHPLEDGDDAQDLTSKLKPKSLMQNLIDSNEIEHASLSRAANGKYLDMALKIGESMRLDSDIVRRWADIVQVYVIKSDKFQQALSESKAPYYDTLRDMSFLGAFTPNFSHDEDDNKRLPALFLQEHKVNAQHDDTMVFRSLNVPREVSNDAVMGHEIGHALNYLAMGGEMLRSEYLSGNKSRDYLTSYPEIIARVYGELPIWRKALFDQMSNLSDRDIVQEAVREEVTENMMTHEAYTAMGGIDPVQEYKRVEKNQWPYQYTDNPIAAANKRVERAKQKVMGEIMEAGRSRRRNILLDILKKIKYYEEQIKLVATADSQNGMSTNEYRAELKKLQQMKVKALNGTYDLEIDSAIQSVIINFVLRNLQNMADKINDPDWKPPFTLLGKDGEEVPPALSPGTEPMSYPELQTLSNYDNNWSKGKDGGLTLEEPKMIEMEFPPKQTGYDQNFRENIEPQYVARMSFNFAQWRRTG